MSVDINTSVGKLRCVGGGAWLLWCERCGDWERLSAEQMEGRVSVNHAATGCPSGYHETHHFAMEVAATVAAYRFAPYGDDPVVRS